MFTISLNTWGTFTFSACSMVSVLLIGYILQDIRRHSFFSSYARLILAAISVFTSGWLHLGIILLLLGVGSTNLRSTVTLLSRAVGRVVGPKLARPIILMAALIAAACGGLSERRSAVVFNFLPLLFTIWLGLLIVLCEPITLTHLFTNQFRDWSNVAQFVTDLILEIVQLVLCCCLVDLFTCTFLDPRRRSGPEER